MKKYTLEKQTIVYGEIYKVWNFFSDPHNLRVLTPSYMNFRIIECPDVKNIFEGMIIKYKVSPLLKIPVTWVTEITTVDSERKFTDVQLKGPFAIWEHTHTFRPHGNETFMTDKVVYRPPFGILGSIANTVFIRKQLEDIFSYREKIIWEKFPPK